MQRPAARQSPYRLEIRLARIPVTELKKPWIAGLLALALGGPGCFYLGWRRGLKATLTWLLIVSLIAVGVQGQSHPKDDASFEFAVLSFILLQSALTWIAYRSCRCSNAQAVMVMERLKYGGTQQVQSDVPRQIKDQGQLVIILSAIALFGNVMMYSNTSPPMGELGHFTNAFSLLMVPLSVLGLATGIGLRRAWSWARLSMLVFGCILAIMGTLLAVPLLLMPSGGGVWWTVSVLKVSGALMFLVPAVAGVRWFRFFTQDRVRAYFHVSRKSPTAPA